MEADEAGLFLGKCLTRGDSLAFFGSASHRHGILLVSTPRAEPSPLGVPQH